ncbi:unnamed protein product [Mytilus edulis]|uniref:Uncharacterized protein n=1 Tax=Mytilus edulis TaxID=6550 RepID=A0A8S3R129_MYTED|nr:unnamed protein product [Mytilus edulis]
MMPSEWLLENRTHVLNRVGVYVKGYIDIFRCYRNRLTSETLNEIKSDQLRSVDGKVYDKIDILSRQAEMQLSNMVFINCSFVFPGTIDVCPKCKHDHKYNLLGYDPNNKTVSKHLDTPPIVSVREPCLVNPNNENKVAHVLDHLKNSCQIPTERKWVVVWSDGIPYLYGMRLQQYVFYCSICDDLVDTRLESLNDHLLHFC